MRRPSLTSASRHVARAELVLSRLDRATLVELLKRLEEPYGPDGWPARSPGPSAAPLAKSSPCPTCKGSGNAKGTERRCAECDGSGKVYTASPGAVGLRTDPADPLRRKREHGYATSSVEQAVEDRAAGACERCQGVGNLADGGGHVACPTCEGSGRRFSDPVGEAARFLFETLEKVADLLGALDKRRQVVLHAGDSLRGRQDAGQGTCRGCDAWVAGTVEDRLRKGLCSACYLSWTGWKLRHDLADFQGDPARRFTAFLGWRKERKAPEPSAS